MSRRSGWRATEGGFSGRNESELDSAVSFGEPATVWRTPNPRRNQPQGCAGRGSATHVKNVSNGVVDDHVVGDSTRRRSRAVRRDHPPRAEEAAGDRGPIVAMKRRNGRGARGAREMEP